MSLLGKLLKTTIHVATLPLDVAKDVMTMAGAVNGNDPATKKKLHKLSEDMDEIEEETDKL